MDVIEYLKEKNIDFDKTNYSLLSEKLSKTRGSTIIIIDYELATKYLESINPDLITPQELLEFHVEFSGVDDPIEFGEAMLKGLRHLDLVCKAVDRDSFVLFEIA